MEHGNFVSVAAKLSGTNLNHLGDYWGENILAFDISGGSSSENLPLKEMPMCSHCSTIGSRSGNSKWPHDWKSSSYCRCCQMSTSWLWDRSRNQTLIWVGAQISKLWNTSTTLCTKIDCIVNHIFPIICFCCKNLWKMLQLLQACCCRTGTCRRRCWSLQGWPDIWRPWSKTLKELWLLKHLQRGCIPTEEYNTLVCKVLFPLNRINLHFQAFNKPLHLLNFNCCPFHLTADFSHLIFDQSLDFNIFFQYFCHTVKLGCELTLCGLQGSWNMFQLLWNTCHSTWHMFAGHIHEVHPCIPLPPHVTVTHCTNNCNRYHKWCEAWHVRVHGFIDNSDGSWRRSKRSELLGQTLHLCSKSKCVLSSSSCIPWWSIPIFPHMSCQHLSQASQNFKSP